MLLRGFNPFLSNWRVCMAPVSIHVAMRLHQPPPYPSNLYFWPHCTVRMRPRSGGTFWGNTKPKGQAALTFEVPARDVLKFRINLKSPNKSGSGTKFRIIRNLTSQKCDVTRCDIAKFPPQEVMSRKELFVSLGNATIVGAKRRTHFT